ncbi:amine oxidase [Streptomyces albidoflavus]|nr:amine oxidase [Streptomyces albidoflavus]SCE20861.1 hypothetical protein GA0115236_13986 [Streptomyces sp. IgraMP-1]
MRISEYCEPVFGTGQGIAQDFFSAAVAEAASTFVGGGRSSRVTFGTSGDEEEMVALQTSVTWVDVRERFPEIGMPVAAAITGRYPAEGDDGDRASGEEFWLVRPMYYTDWYETRDGVTHHHCFVDSDEVVRLPYDRDSGDSVTHWAELPTLPGTETHFLGGQHVEPALRRAWQKPAGA